ncbi:MAG: hypothetical protein V4505_25830 [Pseudomonadota bacterium]
MRLSPCPAAPRYSWRAVLATTLLVAAAAQAQAQAQTVRRAEVEPGPRELSVPAGSPFAAELSQALADYGFVVKPASGAPWPTRYAVSLAIDTDAPREVCASTGHHIVTAKAALQDTQTGQDIATVQARGADGPCGDREEPVFARLADAVGDVWMGQ